MLQQISQKRKNNRGFTLMEMLIVVAIIAILIAIAIPAFSGSLTKAQESADAANLRSAKAAVVVENTIGTTPYTSGTTYYFNNVTGTFQAGAPTAYGQSGSNLYVQSVADANGLGEPTWATTP
jgi:type IV pilus assembly protein PilA